MTVAIGRINPGFLTNIAAISLNGDLKLSGRVDVTAPFSSGVLASMIEALGRDVDNPEIPVVFGTDGAQSNHLALKHFNGFYQVIDSSSDLEPGVVDPTNPIGFPPWGLTLRPIPNGQAPRVESILDSVFRTEATSMVSSDADPWHAIPQSVPGYDDGSGQDMVASFAWATDSGPILYGSDATNSLPLRRVVAWSCRPEHWYYGAATVERTASAVWIPLIGRELGLADVSDEDWGITNGLIRFRWDSARGVFTIECFDGTVWESKRDVYFRVYSSPAFSPLADAQPVSVAIIRNNPAEVRIRITAITHGYSPPSVIDLRLRRGSQLIDVNWAIPNSTIGLGYPSDLVFDPAPSWTSASAGRFSAADANGHILMQMTPTGGTNVPNITSTTFRSAMGFVISGSPVNYTAARNNYYAPSAELVRIVGS